MISRDGQILDKVDLETMPFERSTTGFWIDVPKSILDIFTAKRLNPAVSRPYRKCRNMFQYSIPQEAIHAAEHAFLNQFPLQADVRTECKVAVKEYQHEQSSRQRPARSVPLHSAEIY